MIPFDPFWSLSFLSSNMFDHRFLGLWGVDECDSVAFAADLPGASGWGANTQPPRLSAAAEGGLSRGRSVATLGRETPSAGKPQGQCEAFVWLLAAQASCFLLVVLSLSCSSIVNCHECSTLQRRKGWVATVTRPMRQLRKSATWLRLNPLWLLSSSKSAVDSQNGWNSSAAFLLPQSGRETQIMESRATWWDQWQRNVKEMPAIAAFVVGLLGIVVLVLGLHWHLFSILNAPAINISFAKWGAAPSLLRTCPCLFIYGLPLLFKTVVQDSGLIPIRPTELPAFDCSHSLCCLSLPLNRSVWRCASQRLSRAQLDIQRPLRRSTNITSLFLALCFERIPWHETCHLSWVLNLWTFWSCQWPVRLCNWAFPVSASSHGPVGVSAAPAACGAVLQRLADYGQWHCRVGKWTLGERHSLRNHIIWQHLCKIAPRGMWLCRMQAYSAEAD